MAGVIHYNIIFELLDLHALVVGIDASVEVPPTLLFLKTIGLEQLHLLLPLRAESCMLLEGRGRIIKWHKSVLLATDLPTHEDGRLVEGRVGEGLVASAGVATGVIVEAIYIVVYHLVLWVWCNFEQIVVLTRISDHSRSLSKELFWSEFYYIHIELDLACNLLPLWSFLEHDLLLLFWFHFQKKLINWYLIPLKHLILLEFCPWWFKDERGLLAGHGDTGWVLHQFRGWPLYLLLEDVLASNLTGYFFHRKGDNKVSMHLMLKLGRN